MAHVANPVRFEDRLAARHRQRVERAHRALRVMLEIVEVGRVEAVRDASENAQVDLERLLDLVEDPADRRGGRIAGHLLDLAVAEQVDVEFRADPLDEPGKLDPEPARRELGRVDVEVRDEEASQERRVVMRREREAVIEDHCFQIDVEDDAEHRILEAAHDHRLVDELVLAPAQPAHLLDGTRPARGGCRRHQQHLEIRFVKLRVAERRRQTVGHVRRLLGDLPLAGLVSVAAREQGAADAPHQSGHADRVVRAQPIVESAEQAGAGVGLEGFQRAQVAEATCDLVFQRAGIRAVRLRRPALRGDAELAPAIEPRLRSRKEMVDRDPVRRAVHDSRPPDHRYRARSKLRSRFDGEISPTPSRRHRAPR